MNSNNQKWILLGGSRGLGGSVSSYLIHDYQDLELFIVSRKTNNLKKFESNERVTVRVESLDLTKSQDQKNCLKLLKREQPQRVLFFAAGGPYGSFAEKEWKDHEWSLKLGFLFPAEMLHFILNEVKSVQQVLFVGSTVADSSPDPRASSYAASKHALKGLVTSIQEEEDVSVDLRFFRPGYMDTSLLPPNAKPRVLKESIALPDHVAQDMVKWLLDETAFNTIRDYP